MVNVEELLESFYKTGLEFLEEYATTDIPLVIKASIFEDLNRNGPYTKDTLFGALVILGENLNGNTVTYNTMLDMEIECDHVLVGFLQNLVANYSLFVTIYPVWKEL